MRVKIFAGSFALVALLMALPLQAQTQHPEAISLLGKPLYTQRPKGDAGRDAEARIAAARAILEKDPSSAEAAYALGQADEAAGRLLDAIDVYTIAIEKHQQDAKLLLGRGRLLIVIRKFDIALRDLRSAAAMLPEAHCRAAFATYLKGEFATARDEFVQQCPSSPWAAVAAVRADRVAPPAVPSDDELIRAYYAALKPLVAKDTAHAREQLGRIVDKQSKRWTEDAYIAAEADLARLPKRRTKRIGELVSW
jgi:tetratricopeptide (TPR) repeat protein